jgi:hypothetical protein
MTHKDAGIWALVVDSHAAGASLVRIWRVAWESELWVVGI